MVTDIKTCITCKEEKASDSFHKNKNMPDGHTKTCKACAKARSVEWNRANKEKKAIAGRKWYEENKQDAIDRATKYNKDHPELRQLAVEKDRLTRKLNGKSAEKNARYKLKLKEATPKWYDKTEVRYIYSIARQRDLHVDHIVPLNHKEVCGLHTQENLRCIPERLNLVKNNHYWPNMWDETKAALVLHKY